MYPKMSSIEVKGKISVKMLRRKSDSSVTLTSQWFSILATCTESPRDFFKNTHAWCMAQTLATFDNLTGDFTGELEVRNTH